MKRNKRFRFVIKTDIGGQGHILLNTVPVLRNMFGSWIYKFSLRLFAFNWYPTHNYFNTILLVLISVNVSHILYLLFYRNWRECLKLKRWTNICWANVHQRNDGETILKAKKKKFNETIIIICLLKENESGVAQSCPTLCDSIDCSLPGSSVHGIFQARILEWIAISFSRSSQPRNWTRVSRTVGRHFTHLSHEGSPYTICQ